METLEYIKNKFGLKYDDTTRMPIEIPDYGRIQMASLFNELGFKRGVEIGVRGGDYSLVLCKAIPNLTLYGVDPYTPHVGYRDIVKKSTFDAFETEARYKLAPYMNKADHGYFFIRKYSKDALADFADESLDFVYIDGDHCFEEVTFDIAHWSKKIRKGGIISGDDYFKHKGNARIHVYQAINGYTDAWHIRPWFVLGTKAIIEGQIRDHGRSLMFVKQ